MDDKASFGYVTALGRALADLPQPDVVAKIRAMEGAASLATYLRAVPVGALAAKLDDFLSTHVTDATWLKTRAQLLLAIKLARGEVKDVGPQHGKRGAALR